MGHLINPVSVRLSVNSFWNSNWVLFNNFNYVNLFKKDYMLFHFLNWFTKKQKFGKFNIIISHYKVFRNLNDVYINFYYYNAGLEEKKFKFQVFFLFSLLKARRKVWYKNLKTISTKKVKNMYEYFLKVLVSQIYWYIINNCLSFYLTKLVNNKNNFYFNIYSLNFMNVNVDIISTYISLKLQQRHSLNWVLKPILKDLANKVKKKVFLGYKIVCSGRFTRKQLATYQWTKKGSLHLSKFSSLVKYSEARVRLKYGLCGIKVWLNYGFNNASIFKRQLLLVYPLHVPFKYVLDVSNKTVHFYLNYWAYTYMRVLFFKSRNYRSYEKFIKIKFKILLKYLIKTLSKNKLFTSVNLSYADDNKFILKLDSSKLNNLKLINRRAYE